MNELNEFLSWKEQILSKPNEPTKSRDIYDKFVKYNKSIIRTGYLPESIIQFTDDFLNVITISIADSLLNCDITTMDKSERKLIKLYFNSFFDLGLYGALSQDKSALSALTYILLTDDKPLYKEDGKKNIHTDLFKMLYFKGAIQSFQISITTSQNIELLSMVLGLTQQVEKYDPFFPLQEFYDISIAAIKRIVSFNKDIVIVKLLVSSLDSIQSFLPFSKEAHLIFINEVLPILQTFITSKILEQRQNALAQFLKYAKNDMSKICVANFFASKNRFSLFSSVGLHNALSTKIGELMSIIISNSKLGKPGIIKEIWHQHENMKSKTFELSTFYETFLHISSYLKPELFDEFIDSILNEKPSYAWFEMINKLPNILSNRKGMKDAFKTIREKLWNIINSSNDENNKYIQSLQKTAKISFIQMIGSKPDKSVLIRIKEIQKVDQQFFYELLNSFLKKKNCIDPTTVSEFLISLLMDLSPTNHSPIIINNIMQLCQLCSVLSNEQIDLLLNSIEYFPDFFKFMSNLYKKSILKSNNILYISELINPKFVNDEFYYFMKEFIYQTNPLDKCITKLPIQHEKLIWKYSILESPVRMKFAKLLSRIYQMNDGKQLTDKQMIETFLNNWNDYFWKKQHIETKSKNLLCLLWTFINIYESNMYRDLNVFNSPLSIERTLDIFSVNVICEKPEFNIKLSYPINYTIESVVEEIHQKFDSIGLNNTNVFLNGHPLKRSALIKDAAEDSNSIRIEIKIDKEAIIPHKYHIRTEIPSREIIKKGWNKLYFQMLIENGSEYAYEILKLLPCDSKDLHLDEQLNTEVSDQVFGEFFDVQKPYLFSYNFLLIYFKSANNARLLNQLFDCGVIKYLSDLLIEFNPEPIYIEICDIFNYFIINLLKYIKFDKNIRNDLIITLLTLVEKGFNLNIMETTFEKLLNYNQSELIFDEFPFIRLLFHPEIQVRIFAVKVFNNLKIGLNEYLKILREHDEDVNENFIDSLSNHITSSIDQEIIYEITDLVMELQSKPKNENGQFLEASLTLFHCFLTFNFLNFEKRHLVLQLITTRLLKTDFSADDSIAFKSATNCLTELANTETYTLHKTLEELHSNRDPFTEYSINGNKCSMSKTGRVGLERIGNTCYFNTIMQMLFSIKPIRNIIMTYSGDDNFLKELSKLFVLMKYIKARSINTKNILEYLTMPDGTKVDITIQQDAAEFLYILLNKMHDVEELFCGSCADIYEGISEDFRTENEELFTILDLDVQNVPSLYDSFESFAKSADLTGSNQFHDDASDKYLDVKRSSKIKKAPPFLIIHLKRFELFDLDNIGAKINDKFEVPFEFDISPFATQQFPIYKLTGVIIHSGTASTGHYACLSLSKKGWIKIDDADSFIIEPKEAIKLIQGGTDQSNAYILFYTMEDDKKYQKNEIDPTLLEYVEKMNQINDQKRLFCSTNYFNIIKMLNNLTQLDFNDIVLRYSVDSLPFMDIRNIEKQTLINFYNQLAKKSKMNGFVLVEKFHFLDYSINYLKEDLLLCPDEFVRKKTTDLILLSLNEKANPHKFLILAFNLVKESLNYPTQFDQVFYLIYCILKNYKELKESNQIQEILSNILEKDIIPFINNRPNFMNIDMTYILELVIMYNVFHKLNRNNFILQLFESNTSIDSVVNFVKLSFKDNEKDIKNFIEKNISQIFIQKYIPFYFFFNPDKAIEISFQKIEKKLLKINGMRTANDFDVVCIFADMLSKCPSLSKYFIKNMDSWVPRLLLHPNNSKVRQIALSIFSYVIPHENLIKWHFINDNKIKSNQPKIPYDLAFTSIKDSSHLNAGLDKLCLKVINYLIKQDTIQFICSIFNEKSEKDFNDNFCVEYFRLIEEILIISPKDFDSKHLKNLLKIFEFMIKYQKNPFNESMIHILMLIFKFKIQIPQNLLESGLIEIKCFSKYIKHKSNSNNLINFLTYYFQIYKNFEPSKSFLTKLIKFYLFSPEIDSSWTPIFDYFKSILSKNSNNQKIVKIILGIVDNNFKDFVTSNFSSLLFILNRIKKAICLDDDDDENINRIKRPLLPYLKIVTEKKQYLNINKIIRIAFDLNNGDVNEQVIESVIEKYRYEIDEENLKLLKGTDEDEDENDNNTDKNDNNPFSSSYNSLSDSS